MSDDNPFAPPGDERRAVQAAATGKRPLPPKVIGVIGLCLGVLGILGLLFNIVVVTVADLEELAPDLHLPVGVMILNFAWDGMLAILLCAVGAALVRYRRWGRYGFNAYAALTLLGVLWSVGTLLYAVAQSEGGFDHPAVIGAMVGGVVGGGIALVFPLVGVLLLNRQRVASSLR